MTEQGNERRYEPGVEREYEGPGIRVQWESQLCIHVANCIRGLPAVFDPNARPWVAVENAPAADIARAIESCPTGALRYVRTDGSPQEAPADPTVVQPRLNGPLFLRGRLQFVDAASRVRRELPRAALCRCGGSGNKPFCDGSHRTNGFRAPGYSHDQ